MATPGAVPQTRAMRFSLQVRYAIGGAFDLAYNADGAFVQARTISERQGIPERYLEQLFRRLRRAGLIDARRGPGGGYRLARAPAEVSLRAVVEAIEGPLAKPPRPPRLSQGSRRTNGGQSDASDHAPAFLWQALAERFAGVLETVTLDSLCRDARRAGVPRVASGDLMYFI